MAQRTFTLLVGTQVGDVHKETVSITGVTSTSTGNGLKKADYRWDDGGLQRTIFGTLTSGAHLNLFIYPYPGDTTTKHLEAVISTGSSVYVTATQSFSDVLNGPFWGVEGVKVCASGSATFGIYL